MPVLLQSSHRLGDEGKFPGSEVQGRDDMGAGRVQIRMIETCARLMHMMFMFLRFPMLVMHFEAWVLWSVEKRIYEIL